MKKKEETGLRLIGLTRKSRGEDEGTHDDQRRMIEGRVLTEGATLLRIDQEHKVSGAKDWRKREIGQAILDVAAGEADGIIVAYQDRITRERLAQAAAIWEAMKEAGAVFIACDGVDSRAPGSEMLFTIKAAVAREQWKTYQQRSNDGRKRAVELGVHGGSVAPLGYIFSLREDGTLNASGRVKHGLLILDPETAPRVVRAFEARVAGQSWKHIIQILDLTTQGACYNVLTNRVYLGEARSGEYVKLDAHPALVSEALFTRVQESFRRQVGRRTRGNDQSLLARILVCATCGYAMSLDRSIGSYRCKHRRCASRASIQAERIEPVVLFEALAWHATLNPMYEQETPAQISEAASTLGAALAERDEIEAAESELSLIAYARAWDKSSATIRSAEAILREAEASRGWLGLDTAGVQRRLFGEVPRAETFLESCERIISVDLARDFIRQMVRVTVRPVGRGFRMPALERIEIEQLTPATLLVPVTQNTEVSL